MRTEKIDGSISSSSGIAKLKESIEKERLKRLDAEQRMTQMYEEMKKQQMCIAR